MKTPEHQDNNGPEPLREAPGSATPTWDDCERKYRAMREELGKDMNEYKRRLADYTATLDAWAEAEFSPNTTHILTETPPRNGEEGRLFAPVTG